MQNLSLDLTIYLLSILVSHTTTTTQSVSQASRKTVSFRRLEHYCITYSLSRKKMKINVVFTFVLLTCTGESVKRSDTICTDAEVRVPKEPFVSITANGCGPEGMRIDEEFGLYRCSNRHDICFQSCGVTYVSLSPPPPPLTCHHDSRHLLTVGNFAKGISKIA